MTVENTVTAGAVMVDGYGVGDVGNVSCGTATTCRRTASSL